ncbi:MAG: cytochrome b/b6 domain-containing protein [Mariprofundaceae bacterium]|nr:cytochrome b/b6 domain-containing protein [Mariprofundaceae bacterium]
MENRRFDFRIWHWAHAFVVLGLMATVLLRKTFLSWRSNSELIMQKLAEINIEIGAEQAKVIAKAIRAPMWEWHILLGYALAALLIWRITLFFTQSGSRTYRDNKNKSMHKKAVMIGYIGIYSLLLFMATSGLVMNFHAALGLSKGITHDIKEVHEFIFFYGVLIFVPLHIAGAVAAELKGEPGLISNMIHGKAKL